MRIRIRGNGRNMTLLLPSGLIFSRGTVWLANTFARKYAPKAMEHIPPEAVDVLFAEFRRIKRKHGSWDLVEVSSADGEYVKVTI